MKDLVVISDIGSALTDHSSEAQDYLRDNIELSFGAADKLYVGLYKPFNSVYIELDASVPATSLSFKYSAGSSVFSPLEVMDDTKGLSRSGFMSWNRDIEEWKEDTINGQKLFWVEITFNGAYTANFKGLNIVFSSDYEMELKNPFVMDYLPKNDTTFIRYHVAARNEIVQLLRNGGYIKMPTGSDNLFFNSLQDRQDITKWDLLDIGQIKEAATFKALAAVFFNESRNIEDKEYALYRQYQGSFGQSFKLFYLSLDTDDDGKTDDIEKLASNEIKVTYE
jgi:hypothetical protein